ncbi:MAG: hypothetical protein WC488_04260 [Candidatus Micrarchaeia archaeon]
MAAPAQKERKKEDSPNVIRYMNLNNNIIGAYLTLSYRDMVLWHDMVSDALAGRGRKGTDKASVFNGLTGALVKSGRIDAFTSKQVFTDVRKIPAEISDENALAVLIMFEDRELRADERLREIFRSALRAGGIKGFESECKKQRWEGNWEAAQYRAKKMLEPGAKAGRLEAVPINNQVARFARDQKEMEDKIGESSRKHQA